MTEKTLLLTPGPTNVPEKYANILAEPFPHHRTKAFADLQKELENNLKKIMKAPEETEVILFTSSGSGAMESTVANFFQPKEKVLVVSTGHFGNRYIEMCEQFGLTVFSLVYPVGETYNLEEVKAIIAKHPDLRAIYMTHHETSTGVLNDIAAVGKLTKDNQELLFIVDAVSGLIMHPFEMDEWGVDVVAGASQKGFLLPPGVSFVGLNPKALNRLPHATLPKFYWNYQLMLEYAAKGETPCTPAINLMRAFVVSTRDLLAEGLDKAVEHHENLRKYLVEKLNEKGLEIALKDQKVLGNVCVPFLLPDGVDGMEICRYLEEKHKIIIIGGFGAYAHSMLRVGVIGPLTTADFDQFFVAFEDALATLYKIKL